VNNPPDQLKADLWDFVKHNRQRFNGEAFHHTFHYCDVPVIPPQKYEDGDLGRQDNDVVHMISICFQALKDPQDSEAKKMHITPGVALVLLVHYVGDIHQPLHVGSLYFDMKGPVDPSAAEGTVYGDQGGNKLQIVRLGGASGLHHYWDVTTVTTAVAQMKKDLHLPDAADAELAAGLGKIEPANWKTSGDVASWSQKWADEILPTAQEAHSRLDFGDPVLPPQPDHVTTIVSCPGAEKPGNSIPYKSWSGSVVKNELHTAGWRLAEMLKEALK
jgi:S1/P1 nuclease